jgi:hypothetical protein
VFRSTLSRDYDPYMRLAGWTEVTAVDIGPFVAALPALLAGWRALTFPDGVVRHPATGRPHAGLRLVSGVHPYPGAVYRLVLREETPPDPTDQERAVADRLNGTDALAAAEWERGRLAAARADGRMLVTWHTVVVTAGTDDPRRTTFALHHDVTDARARIDLTEPDRPGPVDVAMDVPDWAGSTGFLRGMVEVLLRADPRALPPYALGEPQLIATVRHPRGRAHADVRIGGAGACRWSVRADVDVRGAGWVRPLVALAAPIARRHLQRELDDILAALPAQFDALAAEIGSRYPAPPDPHTLADRVLADLIAAVPVRIPA